MVPAASGYPQYSGSLIPPMFSMDLIEQFYRTTVFSDITTTEYTGELKKCGDQITIMRTPRVKVRKNVKDGTIKHDTIDSCPVTMTISDFIEFSIKVSQVDIHQICNWSKWEAALLKSASYEMGQTIDAELLCRMALDAHPCNKGTTAGVKSGSYNMGAVGAPVAITSLNIWDQMTYMRAVLKEQGVPMDDLYIVLPDVAEPILLLSPRITSNPGLAGACCNIASDGILNGKLPAKIAGFTVFISPNVCASYDDVNGVDAVVYDVIAGWAGSSAFAAQIEKTRVVDNDKDSWDTYIQGMMVYGHKVIQEEGMALMRARFE
jgi:hypothetical protein